MMFIFLFAGASSLNFLIDIWFHLLYCTYACKCRFYLCVWFKDEPKSQQKMTYYLARLKSKAIVRDSGIVSSLLTRETVKKVTLVLGQNNSFSRGLDKILYTLLVS